MKTVAFAILLAAQGAAVRLVGSIQAIQGKVITLKPGFTDFTISRFQKR